MMKRLTNPVKYGANESEACAVVCPSLPGFGFSDAPQKEGKKISLNTCFC